MSKTTDFARNTLGATLKRADELNLGDRILMPTVFDGEVKVQEVWKLELQGNDDVEVNDVLTTSIGNTFLVL